MSGHAAVAVAIATLIVPYLPRRIAGSRWWWRRWSASRACTSARTCRWTWSAGRPSAGRLAADPPSCGSLGRPSPQTAAKALREQGLEVTGVTPLGGRDARRSARFQAVGPDGEQLFAKLIPRERRDEELLYRAWRMAAAPGRAGAGGSVARPSSRSSEAYLGLLAASAGVSTPQVVPTTAGTAWPAAADPRRLAEQADPAAVGDANLKAAWEEARLHQAGIAHATWAATAFVDADRRPWLVDFDHATVVAPERLRQADLAELLISLAVRFGPDRAVAGAADTLGREPLAAALAAATPAALTRTTREELGDHPTPGTTWPAGSPRRWARCPAPRSGVDLLALPDDHHAALGDHELLLVPVQVDADLGVLGDCTFLSTMALRTTAPPPTSTSCISTDPSTRAPEWDPGPGDRIERRTVPPDTTTPAETIESSACPVRPSPSSNTNLARAAARARSGSATCGCRG